MQKSIAAALLAIPLLTLVSCRIMPGSMPGAPAAPTANATPAPAKTPAAATGSTTNTTAAPAAPTNIVDTAIGDGHFSTLVAALETAGLVDTLKGAGPYTVFAPTDQAFAALPAGTMEELLKDPQGKLPQILLNHVVTGTIMAADISDGMELTTLQGGKLRFTVDANVTKADTIMISTPGITTTISTADITTTNGVIHAIDAVIVPSAQ